MYEYVIGFIAGLGASYVVFKLRFGQIRKLVDTVDDAIADNELTGEEAHKIYDALEPFIDLVKVWVAKRRK